MFFCKLLRWQPQGAIAWCLTMVCAAIVIGGLHTRAAWFTTTSPQQPRDLRVFPARYCALAIPPAQVVRVPRLEVVYCSRSTSVPWCGLGWVVVTPPVLCE